MSIEMHDIDYDGVMLASGLQKSDDMQICCCGRMRELLHADQCALAPVNSMIQFLIKVKHDLNPPPPRRERTCPWWRSGVGEFRRRMHLSQD